MVLSSVWCAFTSVINPLLLLPPSVGSGSQQRLSGTALLHEQKLGQDPEQEECQEAE